MFVLSVMGLMATPLQAQEAGATGNLVITASRLPGAQPFARAVATPEVLARSDSISDALASLPEVFVQQPGGRSGFGSLFLRGSDPNFTSVFLDGILLNNATSSRGGAVNVSEIGAASIERVELVAGPLSSVHGSGALAGAVNLILAGGAEQRQLDLAGGIGTRDDISGFAQWRGPLAAGVGGSLSMEYDDDGEATPGAAFEALSVTAKIAASNAGRPDKLILRYQNVSSRQFPDNSGGAEFAMLRETDQRQSEEWLAGGVYRLLDRQGLYLDTSGAFLSRRDDSETPGVAPSDFDPFGIPEGTDISRYRRVQGQLALGVQQGKWALLAGAEAQHERGRSDGTLLFFGFPLETAFRLYRATYSGFAEASHTGPQWTLNIGGRVDAIEGLKARVTGRAGVHYEVPGTGLALRASLGSSFKAPSFYALGNPFVGNPGLKPESSRTVEAGAVLTGGQRTSLSVTVFHSRFANLIDFIADPAPQLVNRSLVTSTGVSGALALPLGETIDLTAQAQYADTQDEATGQRLLNRPAFRANALLRWRATGQATLTGRFTHVGGRPDYAVPTGPQQLAAYAVVGVDAEWRPLAGLSILATLDNAFDADYSDAIGFPAPAARGRLLVRQRF